MHTYRTLFFAAAALLTAISLPVPLHADIAGAIHNKIEIEIRDESKKLGSLALFKPIRLENLTWYAKKGFSPEDASGFRADADNVIRITEFPVHLNERFNIPPSSTVNHFTMELPFNLKTADLPGKATPAIFLPVIGENWEVFLNGQSLRREIFLNADEQIQTRRTLYRVVIPFDKDMLRDTGNSLVIHFIGDAPECFFYLNNDLGFHFSTDYQILPSGVLTWNLRDVITMNMNGIFILCGFFFIGYFIINKNTLFNLYFGIFCILIALRFFSKTDFIYSVIQNTSIITRGEFLSTILILPVFFLFLQNYFYTKKYNKRLLFIAGVSFLFAIAQIVLPFRIAVASFRIWQFCALPAFVFLVHFLYKAVRSEKKDVVSVAVYVGIMLATALWDLLDAVFFMTGIQLVEFGFFIMLMRLAILSVQRFFSMYEETKKLNIDITRQKNSFYRFVPVDFLHHLNRNNAEDIELGDCVNRNMSVLFSDICSFTTLSEKMTPEENFRFLNGFFWRMEPCISRNHGFVDKYMGDGILALYDDAVDTHDTRITSADYAVQSAVEMHHELIEYNQMRAVRDQNPVNFGIGINTGPLMLGTIGSEHRLDTTVIGNTVNLASRLEGLTRFYKNSIIISDLTYRALTDTGVHATREIDSVQVKGKKDPVVIYEVYDTDEDRVKDMKKKTEPDIAMGIIHYKMRQFSEAYGFFKNAYKVYPDDRLVRIYIQRCRHFMENPPSEKWLGVVKFENK